MCLVVQAAQQLLFTTPRVSGAAVVTLWIPWPIWVMQIDVGKFWLALGISRHVNVSTWLSCAMTRVNVKMRVVEDCGLISRTNDVLGMEIHH